MSTKVDGLENVYDFSIIDLLDEDDFNFENNVKNSEIFGVKIVDNLKYYLCLKVKSFVCLKILKLIVLLM